MRDTQRVTAYGVCRTRRDGGGVVLVRSSPASDLAGLWSLPGGGVDHGEHPEATVIREFVEETGLTVTVTGLRDILDDVTELPHRGTRVHTIRLIYDVVDVMAGDGTTDDGSLRAEVDGTTDAALVVTFDDADDLPLMPFAARALGLSRPASPQARPPASTPRPDPPATAGPASAPARLQRQRPGVYGLVIDQGFVLLTRLSGETPTPGLWTLPGGGIDHGEPAREALAREIWEESGVRLERDSLRSVCSMQFVGTAPTGVVEDFHAVAVVFDVVVSPAADGSRPTPAVMEVAGTTDAAQWFRLDALAGLTLGRLASEVLGSAAP